LPNLVLCSSCHRHFRARDALCPFCGANVALAVAPRAAPALAPGASRSRRYAVSAAFLAGSAVFACGETTNGDDGTNTAGTGGERAQGATGGVSSGGSKSSQGGASTGEGGKNGGDGGASAGAGAGGLGTGGGAGGGITLPTGGSSPTGGASGNAIGRACEGYDERNGCRSADDCVETIDGIGPASCVLAEPARPCGNPQFLPQCPELGCGDGQVCVQETCGSRCAAACTATSCAAGSECVDGQCQPLSCAETQVPCPDGYECDFDATGPGNHCVAVSCDSGDWECEPWQECAQRAGLDVHGCTPLQCADDSDCGTCGYCVNQRCAPQLGICHQLIAMPYGCVWPDEELI